MPCVKGLVGATAIDNEGHPFPCYETIDENFYEFDFIFLNHVFEHLENPIIILENLFKILKNDGHIIIEIPHGNDFLIKNSRRYRRIYWISLDGWDNISESNGTSLRALESNLINQLGHSN